MNYFKNAATVTDIKALYRKLAFQHHPDRGGDTATMQQINVEYHKALFNAHGEVTTDEHGDDHTYYYNADIEQALIDKINELLDISMSDVEVALIGTWVWITGDTKPYKKELGKTGAACRWHSKRKCWYWHGASKHRYSKSSPESLDDLAMKYGYKQFKKPSHAAIA